MTSSKNIDNLQAYSSFFSKFMLENEAFHSIGYMVFCKGSDQYDYYNFLFRGHRIKN